MVIIIIILLLLIPVTIVKLDHSIITKEQLKYLVQQPNCNQYTIQLSHLLSYMCNNIANFEVNNLQRGCINCFQYACKVNNNQPSIREINNCATTYLPDTRYETCINQIEPRLISIKKSSIGECVNGYCGLVHCIRRINSDILVAQCYEQASLNKDLLLEEDQVIFVKNITSCILARSRCSSINPITGQPQSNKISSTTYTYGVKQTTQVPISNSLQITSNGDIRIIALPETINIKNYFCTSQPNLHQSNWLNNFC